MNQEKVFKIRSRAIIIHQGKLLAVKHNNDTEFVALPGGKLEFGESPEQCLVREMYEEFGIQVTTGELLYIHTFTQNNVHNTEFIFSIKNNSDFFELNTKDASHSFEIVETMWLDTSTDKILLPKQILTDFTSGQLETKTHVSYIHA